jgi:hypothetical protein
MLIETIATPTITVGGTGALDLNGAGNTLTSARLIEDAAAESVRQSLDLSLQTSTPLVSAPGGYTQTRRNVLYKSPMTLANSNVTVNTIRFQFSCDPSQTTANKDLMVDRFCAILQALKTNGFLASGLLS